MNYIQTEIDGVWLIEPRVFPDERGYFMEAYKKEEFEANIGPVNFIQDNESKSSFGVLRGLHYQKGEYSQAKLVRVLKGEVLDVAVDLRKSSPTFGKHVCVLLSEENKRQFFIPRGFAHGFAVLSEEAVFTYKVDNKYAPQAEASILYNDEALGIDWPLAESQNCNRGNRVCGSGVRHMFCRNWRECNVRRHEQRENRIFAKGEHSNL